MPSPVFQKHLGSLLLESMVAVHKNGVLVRSFIALALAWRYGNQLHYSARFQPETAKTGVDKLTWKEIDASTPKERFFIFNKIPFCTLAFFSERYAGSLGTPLLSFSHNDNLVIKSMIRPSYHGLVWYQEWLNLRLKPICSPWWLDPELGYYDKEGKLNVFVKPLMVFNFLRLDKMVSKSCQPIVERAFDGKLTTWQRQWGGYVDEYHSPKRRQDLISFSMKWWAVDLLEKVNKRKDKYLPLYLFAGGGLNLYNQATAILNFSYSKFRMSMVRFLCFWRLLLWLPGVFPAVLEPFTFLWVIVFLFLIGI